MNKVAHLYLDVDPFKIIETSFHKEYSQVSESLFSLANEYMGVRGFFDEDYSGNSLIGTYFNGIYDYSHNITPNAYLGIVKRSHFTLNAPNFFKLHIKCNDELLDLNHSTIKDFKRILDLKTGEYKRSFIWIINELEIKISITRLLSMNNVHNAYQVISFESNKDSKVELDLCIDGSIKQWGSETYFNSHKLTKDNNHYSLISTTTYTKKSVGIGMKIDHPIDDTILGSNELIIKTHLNLKKNTKETLTRYIYTDTSNDELNKNFLYQGLDNIPSFDETLKDNLDFFNEVYETSDIEIDGDPKVQQGIRYSIFSLAQTYHGYSGKNNIGAKGLTGEAYSGHAFWDSETYCLPYYLFSNKKASLDLLMFRYNTLDKAKERARMLDCDGACYPIATRNGEEGCNLWQHASLQFQPSTGVFYAITHYMKLYHDEEFFTNYGLEMILEISKFLLSRGQYNQDKTKFSFYSVMGPDEFSMMVNHNTYTNFMAKKVFDYVLNIDKDKYSKVFNKCNITKELLDRMIDASNKMVILYDDKTKLYEQHDGFFDLPHIDIKSIKESEFPLYSHWSYDRIYRNDIIKQPDVLMFMFLYLTEFDNETLKANYEYYEPKCLHESSLSPSIHSVIASSLNKDEEAYRFFEFATRLDLDDYNCNTKEGLHLTSIAAAWMNIVYGFGGLRSDSDILRISPKLPKEWNSYSFKINYQGNKIKITKTRNELIITSTGNSFDIYVYDKLYHITKELRINS